MCLASRGQRDKISWCCSLRSITFAQIGAGKLGSSSLRLINSRPLLLMRAQPASISTLPTYAVVRGGVAALLDRSVRDLGLEVDVLDRTGEAGVRLREGADGRYVKSPFVYLNRACGSLDGRGKASPLPVAPARRKRSGGQPCPCSLERSTRKEWRSQGKKLRQPRAPAVAAMRRRRGWLPT